MCGLLLNHWTLAACAAAIAKIDKKVVQHATRCSRLLKASVQHLGWRGGLQSDGPGKHYSQRFECTSMVSSPQCQGIWLAVQLLQQLLERRRRE